MVFNISKSKILLGTIAFAALVASGLVAQTQGPPVLICLWRSAGQPVTDMTAGDFKIVDQGKPQAIFAFHRPAVGPAAPLAQLEHSNRAGA